MRYDKRIHPASHLAKALLGNFIAPFIIKEKNRLIVLNYHGTQKKYLSNFKAQLDYYSKHFDFISPDEFEDYALGQLELKGQKLLLTFDDGIKNNLYAIDELNKRNISAYFFVVPGFVNCKHKEQKDFFVQNIRPLINPNIDSLEEDFLSLNWSEIKKICERHVIGCHTYSHTITSKEENMEVLHKEIIEAKEIIESHVSKKVNSFCSINNTLLSVNAQAKQMIEKNYDFHFTTFGGINQPINSKRIERINVESHWLLGAVKFALSRLETKRWKEKIETYSRH